MGVIDDMGGIMYAAFSDPNGTIWTLQCRTPLLARAIAWEVIIQPDDELVTYAAALQTGTAEAGAILKRFPRQTGHSTEKASAELGRVIKTIVRQDIQEGLNVIENGNSANRVIFSGRASYRGTDAMTRR